MLTNNSVILRSIEIDDLEQLRVWRNNPDLRKYFREHSELSKQDQMNWYEKVVLQKTSTFMFAITDRGTKNLLGACGLCYLDWLRKSADLSIYIGFENIYLDDKYAKDSANALIKYGFEELGLHRLWAEVYSHDAKKQDFFKQLKFTLDGRFRESHWSEGRWLDSLYFGRLATDA